MSKRTLFVSALLAALFLTSCASMKRDCMGRKHVRLQNGIYL